MGYNHPCGCRESGGEFYPCEEHKEMIKKDIQKKYDEHRLKEMM